MAQGHTRPFGLEARALPEGSETQACLLLKFPLSASLLKLLTPLGIGIQVGRAGAAAPHGSGWGKGGGTWRQDPGTRVEGEAPRSKLSQTVGPEAQKTWEPG